VPTGSGDTSEGDAGAETGGGETGGGETGGHGHGNDHRNENDHGASDDGDGDDATGGRPPVGSEAPHESVADAALTEELRRLGVGPADHPAAGHGVVVHSDAPPAAVRDEVEGLRENFDHYDTHVTTVVVEDDGAAVVSLWRNERAATTASGFLFDLPGANEGIGGPLGADDDEDGGADVESDGTGHGDDDAGGTDDTDETDGGDIREELSELGVYAGQPHGEDVHAVVVYSTAGVEELHAAASRLRGRFEEYDTHVKTATYAASPERSVGEGGPGRAAVVSLWETADAADTAAEYLADLPGVVARAGDAGEDAEGFGTMGMFYAVKPEYREEFLDRFDDVGELLSGMDGHEGTDLLVDHEDANDMFIASRWASREDAMAFFRSEDFRETVAWGREVLADRPRHVFLT